MSGRNKKAVRQIVKQWIDGQTGWVWIDYRRLPRGCNIDEVADAIHEMERNGLLVVHEYNNATAWKVASRQSAEKGVAAIVEWRRDPEDNAPFRRDLFNNPDRIMAESHSAQEELEAALQNLEAGRAGTSVLRA